VGSGRTASANGTASGSAGTGHQIRQIGWLLAWAVVFCDIGTSIYYVPGILYHHVGNLAPFFVLMATGGFLLLAQKYGEVSWRNPEGGGVVTVARKAFGSWWGAIGGILITIDYFLTSAISSVSGFAYLSSVMPALRPHVELLACAGIALLCLLNIIGIRESASVALGFAAASLLANFVVVIFGLFGLKAHEIEVIGQAAGQFKGLSPHLILIGFAGSWLAFSGLESISQLSPALKLPTRKTVRYAMWAVVGTVVVTSPTLTALAIAVIPDSMKSSRTDSFISDLAMVRSGPLMQISVVAAASALLLFAANTAMIGGYHVFLALSRDRFFPRLFAKRNARFSTPHWAILITTAVPLGTILLTHGKLTLLGDMYSFGLLGAFTFTALGLDVIRWRERQRGWLFWIGVLTTVMVAGSWATNIIEKPLATIYGGTLTVIGILGSFAIRRDWIVHAVNRIPVIGRRAALLRARTELAVEEEQEIVSIPSALAMRTLYPSTTIVAVLNYNQKLMDEAIRRVRGQGEHALYLISVTEWPGLFSGAETRPSSEVVQAMNEMGRHAQAQGVFVIPIWAISDNAARTIAHAAQSLRCDAVMMGVSQRSAIYHMLRGNVLRGLTRILPENYKIITVG
jgi:amino acid transporter